VSSTDPEVFGEYLLVGRLASSPMAETSLAVRLGDRTGRTYVVKRPRLGERASGAAAQAILRETEVLGAVRSPHLVALEASGAVGGLPFVALEHLRGAPLDRILASGALGELETRAIARDVLGALAALDEAGWVHGDVAPSNVVVDEMGESRLIDLGIARKKGESRALPAGKPGYIAPEATFARPAAPSEDVYALAVVAAECLLGARLFPEQDLSEAATRDGAPSAVRDLDTWGPMLTEALALDAQKRPTAAALRDRLAPAPEGREALAGVVARVRASSDRAIQKTLVDPEPPQTVVKELTPTAPLVVPASVPPAAVVDDDRPKASAPAAAPPRRSLAVFALVAIVAAAAGWMVGRRAGPPRGARDASLGLSAPLPARDVLSIDGRPIAVPEPGKKIPVNPGRHTISITAPRKDVTQTFDVVVDPGEHVVLLVQPGGGGAGRKGDRKGDVRDGDTGADIE
jgi:hypothetical protein